MSAPNPNDASLEQLWAGLPYELKVHILSFLSPTQLASVRTVGPEILRAADEAAWQQVLPQYERIVKLNDTLAMWLATAEVDDAMTIDETDLENPQNRAKVQAIYAEIDDILAVVAAKLGLANIGDVIQLSGHRVYNRLARACLEAMTLQGRYLEVGLDQ